MNLKALVSCLAPLSVCLSASILRAAPPASTAFTYQGLLRQGGNPANGAFDLRFWLYDALTGGTLQGSSVCVDNALVTDGRFTVSLDFGSQFNGQRRYLEIEVRPDAGSACTAGSGYTLLAPRQELTGVPYALFALSADGGGMTNLNAANITSGTIASSRMPNGGNWSLSSPLNLDSGTLLIDPATDRLGIGTSSPQAKLHIGGGDLMAGAAGEEWLFHSRSAFGSDFLQITDYDSGVPQFQRGLTLHQNGNIGIGTTGPGRPLHVSNNGLYTARFSNGHSTAAVVEFQNTASNAIWEFGVAGSVPQAAFPGLTLPLSISAGSMYFYRQGQSVPALLIDPGGTLRTLYMQSLSFSAGSLAWTDALGVSGRGSQFGIFGATPSTGNTFYAVYGVAGGAAHAVYADGKLTSNGTKAFRIDHPADPQNKYLSHYCAESPDVINFYSGIVLLDSQGEAEVALPSYFASINRDPRYSLTAVGAPMPMLHVFREIDSAALEAGAQTQPGEAIPACSFRIAGGVAGAKVSWEVKAVRNDRFVRQYGAPVEEDKGADRGSYQRPELYGESNEMLPANHPNNPNNPNDLNNPRNQHVPAMKPSQDTPG